MNRTKLAILILAGLMLLGVATGASAQVAKKWDDIKAPQLNKFEIQQPKRIELSNGAVIFLQPDTELPLIRGTIFFRGGSIDEPAEKTGLASIYGQVWRTGGTKSKNGDDLDDYLEARAAVVETGADIDSSNVSFDCLKDDFDDVFAVVIDLIRNPEFREEKIPLAKNQINTGIARRNDNSQAIVGREATKLVYGADSPYARVPEYDTVGAVTRDDLVAWHGTYVHANNMIVGITGDFDVRAMERKLRNAFDKWKKGPEAKTTVGAINPAKPGFYFVAKDDVTQSEIRMVHRGIKRDNPDYFAVTVMNEIFGGGFAARLFSHLRSDKGLAYAVGGGIGSDFDHDGVFLLRIGTKSETTVESIKALFNEIDLLQNEPILQREIDLAKESILNSFVFRVDSKEEILREKMRYEFYGYPLDFLEQYRRGIEATTLEDVTRVAKKYIHKDQIATIVVGKAADFDAELSTLGPVTTIDITIPAPGASKQESVAGNAEGKALMKKVAGTLGDAASIHSVRRAGSMTIKTPGGEMALDLEVLEVYPDRIRQAAKTPMGDMVMVASPDASFMVMGGQSRDLPGSQKEEMINSLRKSPIHLASNIDNAAYAFSADGTETIGEVDTGIVRVDADGVRVTFYVDQSNGQILRSVTVASGMGGAPQEMTSDYSDFREVDGVLQPFKIVVSADGEVAQSITLKEIEINPEIDEAAFAKPE